MISLSLLGQKKFNRGRIFRGRIFRGRIFWWLEALPLGWGIFWDGISLSIAEQKKWLYWLSWAFLLASGGFLGWQGWSFYQAWQLPQTPQKTIIELIEIATLKIPLTSPSSQLKKTKHQDALSALKRYQDWQKLQPVDPQLNYNLALIQANSREILTEN